LSTSFRISCATGTFTDIAFFSCDINFGFSGSSRANPTNADAITPAIGDSTQMNKWLPVPWSIAS
jgi:hypothetical protein